MSIVEAKIQTVEDMYRLIWTAIANSNRSARFTTISLGCLPASARPQSAGATSRPVLSMRRRERDRFGADWFGGELALRCLREIEAGGIGERLLEIRAEPFSSSDLLMHRGLWIPCGRTESFFPLSPSRQSWTTNARAAAKVPAAWIAAFIPSGIIRAPSVP